MTISCKGMMSFILLR